MARYERAERLAVLPRDMEREYEVHRDEPGYLYRTEELILSHDTVENRFLKYALQEMHQKFLRVRSHIRTSLLLEDNARISMRLDEMNETLKGLEYVKESKGKRYYFLSSIDSRVNEEKTALENGTGKVFVSGYSTLEQGINFREIRYLLVVANHKVQGVYDVENVSIADMSKHLAEKKASDPKPDKYEDGYNRPYRIKLMLGKYTKLEKPFNFGLDRIAAKGKAMTKKEFKEYCEGVT